MTDLADILASTDKHEGSPCPIKDAKGNQVGTIWLLSRNSDEWQQGNAELAKKDGMNARDAAAFLLSYVSLRTDDEMRYEGQRINTREDFERLYRELKPVREQVDIHLAADANFIKRAETG